jgi:hypothetical protein
LEWLKHLPLILEIPSTLKYHIRSHLALVAKNVRLFGGGYGMRQVNRESMVSPPGGTLPCKGGCKNLGEKCVSSYAAKAAIKTKNVLLVLVDKTF